jgi:hypothetical protein
MEPGEVPLLVVHEGQLAGRKWSIDRDELIIGRGEGSDIVLPERLVSRSHVRVGRDEQGYFVEDLDSKNGTHINGQPLVPGVAYRLQDGDEIQVALSVRLLFVGAEATLPLSLEAVPTVPAAGSKPTLRLDKAQRRVWVRGREVDPLLSLAQYRLLELLYDASGRVVSRDEVVTTVWPEAVGEGVSEQAIDALVRRLRDRLAEFDPEHEYILTVRGHGFRLDTHPG